LGLGRLGLPVWVTGSITVCLSVRHWLGWAGLSTGLVCCPPGSALPGLGWAGLSGSVWAHWLSGHWLLSAGWVWAHRPLGLGQLPANSLGLLAVIGFTGSLLSVVVRCLGSMVIVCLSGCQFNCLGYLLLSGSVCLAGLSAVCLLSAQLANCLSGSGCCLLGLSGCLLGWAGAGLGLAGVRGHCLSVHNWVHQRLGLSIGLGLAGLSAWAAWAVWVCLSSFPFNCLSVSIGLSVCHWVIHWAVIGPGSGLGHWVVIGHWVSVWLTAFTLSVCLSTIVCCLGLSAGSIIVIRLGNNGFNNHNNNWVIGHNWVWVFTIGLSVFNTTPMGYWVISSTPVRLLGWAGSAWVWPIGLGLTVSVCLFTGLSGCHCLGLFRVVCWVCLLHHCPSVTGLGHRLPGPAVCPGFTVWVRPPVRLSVCPLGQLGCPSSFLGHNLRLPGLSIGSLGCLPAVWAGCLANWVVCWLICLSGSIVWVFCLSVFSVFRLGSAVCLSPLGLLSVVHHCLGCLSFRCFVCLSAVRLRWAGWLSATCSLPVCCLLSVCSSAVRSVCSVCCQFRLLSVICQGLGSVCWVLSFVCPRSGLSKVCLGCLSFNGSVRLLGCLACSVCLGLLSVWVASVN